MDARYYSSMVGIIAVVMIYFSLTLYVYPEKIYQQSDLVPIPMLDVTLSSNEIKMGDSFVLEVASTNAGDLADVQVVSLAFPDVRNITDTVKITNYDFSHSPHYVSIGDEIGAKYSGGTETVFAEYPSIEAYSRPAPSGTTNLISIKVTPPNLGSFDVYVKAIGIPHFTDKSHYPKEGMLDHQSEFVDVYSVTVNP